MPAAYDNFDYPQYWCGREYEHESELIAIASFLKKIPHIHRLMDVGAGYGRLSPEYIFRTNQVYLVDSSAKLLKLARKKFKGNKKFKYIHSKIENVKNKIQYESMDLVIVVRILHHIEDLNKFIWTVDSYIKKGGFLILEFPNKKHIKSLIRELVRGNLTYPLDIFPENKNKEHSATMPFKNYHPDLVRKVLLDCGYEIIEVRSVSNIRSEFLKRNLPKDFLLFIERTLQRILSLISFGPSIFILAQKK